MSGVALLISFHNWSGKRQGGFHKFAEALCGAKYTVGFLSFPRPWYGALKRSERENAARLFGLVRGETFSVGEGELLNFAVPTFGVPGRLRRYMPASLVARLEGASVPPVTSVCRRRLPSVDLVMFESTSGLLLYDEFRRAYPGALTVYRPSDPLAADPDCEPALRAAERHVLESADLVLLVDEAGGRVYEEAFPDLDIGSERFHEVPNGVHLEAFRNRAPSPECFEKRPVALYIGALGPNWTLLRHAAATLSGVTFVVVCPERPPQIELDGFLANPNTLFVPGVLPADVPRYVANCDVFLVPYDKQMKPAVATLGVTAKMLQAMAARKAIVAYDVNAQVGAIGVAVCETKEDFVRRIEEALGAPPPVYAIDLEQYDWRTCQGRFLDIVRQRAQTLKRPGVGKGAR